MTHYFEENDARGDLVELVPFCSDSCHREWCEANDREYGGWNGPHEQPDYSEYCAQCGVIACTGPDACVCQQGNIIVNRFTSTDGEKCRHDNWIQLPADQLGG